MIVLMCTDLMVVMLVTCQNALVLNWFLRTVKDHKNHVAVRAAFRGRAGICVCAQMCVRVVVVMLVICRNAIIVVIRFLLTVMDQCGSRRNRCMNSCRDWVDGMISNNIVSRTRMLCIIFVRVYGCL